MVKHNQLIKPPLYQINRTQQSPCRRWSNPPARARMAAASWSSWREILGGCRPRNWARSSKGRSWSQRTGIGGGGGACGPSSTSGSAPWHVDAGHRRTRCTSVTLSWTTTVMTWTPVEKSVFLVCVACCRTLLLRALMGRCERIRRNSIAKISVSPSGIVAG